MGLYVYARSGNIHPPTQCTGTITEIGQEAVDRCLRGTRRKKSVLRLSVFLKQANHNLFLNVTIDSGGEVLLPVQWRELPSLAHFFYHSTGRSPVL